MNNIGADPALYSLKLMHYSALELDKYDNFMEDLDIPYETITPKQVLERAYTQTNHDAHEKGILGSSTAILVILRDDELRMCNLGDCGLLVVRCGEPIFRSEEQQHSFNFPYQLGTSSKGIFF